MIRSLLDTVVVGFDGSSAGDRALDWAADEAQQRGLRLHVIHVWQPPPILPAGFSVPSMPDSEVVLQDAQTRVTKIAPDVELTTQASPGAVATALVDASVEADTVVVGARGHRRSGVRDFGSTAWQVATHALCPVVVVHDLRDAAARTSVVVGVDGSRGAASALAYAFARADRAGLDVVAVHGWHQTALDNLHYDRDADLQIRTLQQLQLAQLASWVAPAATRFPHVAVRSVAVQEHPARALLHEAELAQLVVVGSRGLGGFRGLLLGSVGMALLREAEAPVAIVRY